MHETTEFQTLTPCGRVQAEKSAKAMLKIPELPDITKIYCSTMPRARETCFIINETLAEGLPPSIEVEFDDELEEGTLTLPHVLDRFERVFKKIFVPVQGLESKAEVIVAHSNLIRFMVCR